MNDWDGQVQEQEEKVISLFSTVPKTRNAINLQSEALDASVMVGVFGVASEGATISNNTNITYTTGEGSVLMAPADQELKCSGTAVVYAYAPYESGWELGADNSFSVSTDQSNNAGYLASDLLYAKTPEAVSTVANLTFEHMLARVCVSITNSTGKDITLSTVEILNTKVSTTLNISSGSVGEESGAPTPITLAKGMNVAAGESINIYGVTVPQSVDEGVELIKVTSGKKVITVKTGELLNLESKKSNNIAVDITT